MDKISKKMRKQIKALQKQLDVSIKQTADCGYGYVEQTVPYIDAIDRMVNTARYWKEIQ